MAKGGTDEHRGDLRPDKRARVRDHSCKWAEQFKKKDPENRDFVKMETGSPEEVISASEEAAKKAGGDGTIIYAVGHGGGSGENGMADFGPRGDFRVTMYVAFNDISTSYSGTSLLKMEKDLETAEDTPNQRAKKRAVQKWCKANVAKPCSKVIEAVRDRSAVQPYYERLAQVYRAHKVREIIMMSCNIGNAPQFLDEISTDFQVPVGSYTHGVMSEDVGEKVRYMFKKDVKKRGRGTNTARAETEIPPTGPADFYLGQVLASYDGPPQNAPPEKMTAPDIPLPPKTSRIEVRPN